MLHLLSRCSGSTIHSVHQSNSPRLPDMSERQHKTNIMRCHISVLLGLLLLGLATASATVAFTPVDVSILDKNTDLISLHAMRGALPLRDAWKAVWAPVHVTFNCSSAEYTVVSAPSLEDALSTSNVSTLRCRRQRALPPTGCIVQLSPFREVFIAAKPVNSGLWKAGELKLQCTISSNSNCGLGCWTRIVVAATALLLFVSALKLVRYLTKYQLPWQSFSSAGLLGIAGLPILLHDYLSPRVPTLRSETVAAALSFSGTLSVLFWIHSTWHPSLSDVLTSKLCLGYICTIACIEAVKSAVDDDFYQQWHVRYIPCDVKVAHGIAFCVRGFALGMLYGSMAGVDERLAVGTVVLLLIGNWLLTVWSKVYFMEVEAWLEALQLCGMSTLWSPRKIMFLARVAWRPWLVEGRSIEQLVMLVMTLALGTHSGELDFSSYND